MDCSNLGYDAAIHAIVVTYGNREELLRPVLQSLLKLPLSKIILVDNGTRWELSALVERLGSERIEEVRLDANGGSAAGYSRGISKALELGAQYLWLVDDDTQPEEGALEALIRTHKRLGNEYPPQGRAVLAYRPTHQADVAAGVPVSRINPRRSSFWGFHLLDIPYKIWRRTPWGRPDEHATTPSEVELYIAPYSGLFFHRSLAETYGLPREDFVLYGDDTEFTYRVTHDGGTIRLVTAARMDDLESSWNIKSFASNSFLSWLREGNDLRAFYSARNGTFIDYHCREHNRLMLVMNKTLYSLILWFYSKMLGLTPRYQILQQAIRDGRAGRLGMHPHYPL